MPVARGPWGYVGDATAWLHVDLQALRADERTRAVWEGQRILGERAPGGRAEGPFDDTIAGASALIVAWPDAGFAQRLNVVIGDLDGAALAEQLRSGTLVPGVAFQPESVAGTAVWTAAEAPWAVALPETGVLLTGDADAIRSALLGTGAAATPPNPGRILTADLSVRPAHRHVIHMIAARPEIQERLDEIERIRAEVVLGLGLDARIQLQAAPGADHGRLAVLVGLVLHAVLADADALSGTVATALREAARIETHETREEAVIVTWQLDRGTVDAWSRLLLDDSTQPPDPP